MITKLCELIDVKPLEPWAVKGQNDVCRINDNNELEIWREGKWHKSIGYKRIVDIINDSSKLVHLKYTGGVNKN